MNALLPAVLLAVIAGPAPDRATCADMVRPYGDAMPVPSTFDLTEGPLTVVGAEHLRDPAAPQFAMIRRRFATFRPTLVLYEGPDRGVAATADATIETRGESGLLRFLAGEAGIAARSLEPSPIEQVAALRTRFADDEILLFFTLREMVRLRDREGVQGPALDQAMAQLLGRTAKLAAAAKLVPSIHDLPTLEKAIDARWPGRDWRMVPASWFTPLPKGPVQFTNRINAADSDFRNRHVVRLVAEALNGDERVMIVIGRDHVPRLQEALRCTVRMNSGRRTHKRGRE